jgi:hypothetical protein
MRTTFVAAICGCVLLRFAADSWSATQHARPYEYGPLEKCLIRKGFYYERYVGLVNYSGVAAKSSWRTKDRRYIIVIVMVNPNRATYLRHRLVADLAREWHISQTKIQPGLGRRGNVVWQNFKLTTNASPPVAPTPTDLATIVDCLPPKR